MSNRTRIVASVVVGVIVGWMAHGRMNPPNERPVLSAIARVIRNWWWVPLVLDDGTPPPPEAGGEPPIVGADGYPIVQHGRSI